MKMMILNCDIIVKLDRLSKVFNLSVYPTIKINSFEIQLLLSSVIANFLAIDEILMFI